MIQTPLSWMGWIVKLFAWILEFWQNCFTGLRFFAFQASLRLFGGRALDGYFVVQIQSPSSYLRSIYGAWLLRVLHVPAHFFQAQTLVTANILLLHKPHSADAFCSGEPS
jgi:hypothetical protein